MCSVFAIDSRLRLAVVKIASNRERSGTRGSLMAVLILSVLGMTSCGLGSEATAERASSTEAGPSVGEPTGITSSAATPVEAETAYLRRCGGCHGAAGTEQAAQSWPRSRRIPSPGFGRR